MLADAMMQPRLQPYAQQAAIQLRLLLHASSTTTDPPIDRHSHAPPGCLALEKSRTPRWCCDSSQKMHQHIRDELIHRACTAAADER